MREAYLHLRVQVLRSKYGPLHRHGDGSLASSSHASRRASMESLHMSPETSSPRLPRRQLSAALSHGLVPTKSAEASRCAVGWGGEGGADHASVSAVPAGRWRAMTPWPSTTPSAGCITSLASTEEQVRGGGGACRVCPV